VNGGSWKAAQTARIAAVSSILFRNGDVMPHRLVQMGAPALSLAKSANMDRPGASFTLAFRKAGTYRFKTVAGEDYMKGDRTIGADNVLTLTVTVT
jgi:plastocyanin